MDLFRAHIMDVDGDPLRSGGRLRALSDGALAVEQGIIMAVDDYETLLRRHPGSHVHDHRGSFLLPGLIDVHVHYPQLPVIGAMGLPLLSWLNERTFPAEARLNSAEKARPAARNFLQRLAANGTTTALVFGSHNPEAQQVFFEEVAESGLRISSGLSLGDRDLPEALLRDADDCYRNSLELIKRWNGTEGIRYAVTPRFSVCCSEAVLDICGSLMRENEDLLFQTHINENRDEVDCVRMLFPWAEDYFATYERYGLTGSRCVYAHNLHAGEDELSRMAAAEVAIAHCPSSNAFLGSGSFPMRQHLEHGIPFAAASDVGGGTGFSLFKEALAAYEAQMLRDDGVALNPTALLHLVTGAGAKLLGMDDLVGSLESGKQADFIVVSPPPESTLAAVIAQAGSSEQILGALITLAREESVASTWVAGREVYRR